MLLALWMLVPDFCWGARLNVSNVAVAQSSVVNSERERRHWNGKPSTVGTLKDFLRSLS